MKIICEPFKKWIKVLETYQEKGDQTRESLYLNFDDEYCYFSSSEGIGKMKFYFDKKDGETIPNFFVNTNKFLNIISQYDDVELNEKFVFSSGKDKYKLAVIVDEELVDNTFVNEPFVGREIEFTKDQVEQIFKASIFTNKDEQNIEYRNLFIKDQYICALTTPTPLYEAKFDSDVECSISLNVSKTLNIIGTISEGCVLCVSEGSSNKKILSRDRELELIVSGSSSTEFPPNRNEAFITGYTYGNVVEVETSKFQKTLQSLRPYYNDVVNTKINITFDEDILFEVNDTLNNIEKHVAYIECDPKLKGICISISAAKVEQVISVLRGGSLFIDVPTEDNKPIVNFWNDEDQHALITRFNS